MELDFNLIPNIKNLDPKFLKPTFDPTGEFHVIKDFGITMFFYQNTIVKPSTEPKTMKDFYDLLNAKQLERSHERARRRRGGRAPRGDGARLRRQHRRSR